jgi:4-hydroxybenzoate polyprenyltransferase
LVFVLSCALLSQALFYLSPVLLTLIWGYAYTKRVTALCHFVMGLISGLAPVCAWLALVGTWDLAPVLMGLALLCSIAAMDIVYALQDYAHDRAHGIHSVPVALGQEGAVWLARGLHVLTVVLLTWMGLELELPSIYFVGTAAVGVLLLYHHQAIQPERGQLIYSIFFACNARVGLLVLATVIGVLVWDVMLSA